MRLKGHVNNRGIWHAKVEASNIFPGIFPGIFSGNVFGQLELALHFAAECNANCDWPDTFPGKIFEARISSQFIASSELPS